MHLFKMGNQPYCDFGRRPFNITGDASKVWNHLYLPKSRTKRNSGDAKSRCKNVLAIEVAAAELAAIPAIVWI
jgi:hypothetical protein